MARITKHLSYPNVVATLALVFAMTGGAIAASGGFTSNGTLQACVNEEGGLKLLKAGKHCKRGQKAVAWNQTGPAGAAGATGAPGAVGAPGAPGAAGAKGAQGIQGESAFTNVVVRESTKNASGFITVQCEPGEVAIGGGGTGQTSASHLYGTGPLNEQENFPTTGETPRGWFAQVQQSGLPITVYAICAS